MPAIEGFAEIGEYMDQPVRTYLQRHADATGIQCSHLPQADILIVDEALSVGDAYFQHKEL